MIITLTHNHQLLTFDVQKRKRQKRIIIRPKSAQTYTVTAPKYATKREITSVIHTHLNQLLTMKPLLNYHDYLLQSTHLPIFDQWVEVKVIMASKNEAVLEAASLKVYLKDVSNKVKVLKAYLSQRLMQEIKNYEKYYQENSAIDLKGIHYRTRYLKSKFGSCTPHNKTIGFNLILVHYPKAYLHYIYAHEIAHLKEANHALAFYRVLGALYPNHKQVKAQLNAHHKQFITSDKT